MADTGDKFPAPDQWPRINPSTLTRECQKCGGSGNRMERVVERGLLFDIKSVILRYVGKCDVCLGSGKIPPRTKIK